MAVSNETLAAIRRLKGEGLRDWEIGLAVGLSTRAVESICYRHKIRKPTGAWLELPVGARLMKELQAEAARRKQPFAQFMRELLRRTVQDNLVSAILDDGK